MSSDKDLIKQDKDRKLAKLRGYLRELDELENKINEDLSLEDKDRKDLLQTLIQQRRSVVKLKKDIDGSSFKPSNKVPDDADIDASNTAMDALKLEFSAASKAQREIQKLQEERLLFTKLGAEQLANVKFSRPSIELTRSHEGFYCLPPRPPPNQNNTSPALNYDRPQEGIPEHPPRIGAVPQSQEAQDKINPAGTPPQIRPRRSLPRLIQGVFKNITSKQKDELANNFPPSPNTRTVHHRLPRPAHNCAVTGQTPLAAKNNEYPIRGAQNDTGLHRPAMPVENPRPFTPNRTGMPMQTNAYFARAIDPSRDSRRPGSNINVNSNDRNASSNNIHGIQSLETHISPVQDSQQRSYCAFPANQNAPQQDGLTPPPLTSQRHAPQLINASNAYVYESLTSGGRNLVDGSRTYDRLARNSVIHSQHQVSSRPAHGSIRQGNALLGNSDSYVHKHYTDGERQEENKGYDYDAYN